MAKIKQTFLADDGKEFPTELAADGHNRLKQEEAKIEAYCAKVGLQKAQLGLLKKHISGYLVYTSALPAVALEEADAEAETADES